MSLLNLVKQPPLSQITIAIIEADGELTQPLPVQKIDMFAGQRYSVILHANQPVGNYWFNAPFVGGSPARNPHRKHYD